MGHVFNQLSFGVQNDYIVTVIEIPKGSTNKIEWRRMSGYMALDRVEPMIFAKPCNYGFIPQTLDEDGDELDTLVITGDPISTGVVIEEARVIGVLIFEDDGEMDHKIICVPSDDRHYGKISSFEELGEQWKKQIEHHFVHYKDLKKPGSTVVRGFGDVDEAWKIIAECSERAQTQKWW
jgi:inorganic pyrophosphatase